MLQSIRDKATGWIAWIIVILLVIPFALWGVHEYFGGSAEVIVAEVDGVPIQRDLLDRYAEREIERLKERPEGKALVDLKRSVLDRMIEEQLLASAAERMGMRISPAQVAARIRAIEAFQHEGRFDPELYKRVLLQNRLTVAMFEAQQARAMLIQQLADAVTGSALVTDADIDRLLRLEQRQVELGYALVPVARFAAGVEVSEDDARSYYEEHRDRYVAPEQVKIDYILLDPRELRARVPVEEERVRALYEQQKALYRVPEQRRVAHILIKPEGDDEAAWAAALERAQEVRERLLAGEDFAGLAREVSEDPGSAVVGGDLGWIKRGLMDPAFEEAAFALAAGELSEPVRSRFGYHIIRVEEVRAGREKTYAEVRDELIAELRKEEAENLYYDLADQLYDLSYDNPSSLEPAADALGLELRHSPWFGRDGADSGVAADPAVVAAAFSPEVLAGGDPARSENSPLVELHEQAGEGPAPVVVLRLAGYRPARQQAFEEVREQVVDTLRRIRALEQAQALARELRTRLEQGTPPGEAAAALDLEWTDAGWVGRSGGDHDAAVVEAAFRTPMPAEGAATVRVVAAAGGDPAVIRVSGVRDGDAEKDATIREFMGRFVRNMYGNAELQALVAALRAEAEIVIHEQVLRATAEG